jgi:hypothetical protein
MHAVALTTTYGARDLDAANVVVAALAALRVNVRDGGLRVAATDVRDSSGPRSSDT